MTTEHRFIIEISAVAHRDPKDETGLENWKYGVEQHVAKTLLYDTGKGYSAIVRITDPTIPAWLRKQREANS